MGTTTEKFPVLNCFVTSVFLTCIFIGPLWMLLADIEPATTLNSFQTEIFGGNCYAELTYLLLMFAFALAVFFIIFFVKRFWAIITGKNNTETSQLFNAEKPKKQFNVFFHLKELIYRKANVKIFLIE